MAERENKFSNLFSGNKKVFYLCNPLRKERKASKGALERKKKRKEKNYFFLGNQKKVSTFAIPNKRELNYGCNESTNKIEISEKNKGMLRPIGSKLKDIK